MPKNTALPLSAVIVALIAVSCVRLPHLAPDYPEPIVAIDVALEADRTPPESSAIVKPHITLLQGFVRSSNVHPFTANIAMVMATTDLERLSLKTTASGMAIAVDPSPELRRLQERIAEVFSPYAVDPSDDTSLIVTPDGSSISSDAIRSVGHFVPDASGVNYRPRVVAGAGQQPATAPVFRPIGAAVYQLDRSGLAQRTLWTWTGESGVR